jgi:hypothetical protein
MTNQIAMNSAQSLTILGLIYHDNQPDYRRLSALLPAKHPARWPSTRGETAWLTPWHWGTLAAPAIIRCSCSTSSRLRPGNVHSTDGRREVLEPAISSVLQERIAWLLTRNRPPTTRRVGRWGTRKLCHQAVTNVSCWRYPYTCGGRCPVSSSARAAGVRDWREVAR